jgi:glutamate N-acetyltransferase/amino-acid N-acetyltransferase
VNESIALPQGFQVAGVHCGIKRNPNKQDLSLLVSDRPATAAGVYTTNLVFAAPVGLDRARTPGADFRVIVINSGNANACTGPKGDEDAAEMARLAAAFTGAKPGQALVMSTGVIGLYLPMEKIAAGIADAANQLGVSEENIVSAARGMLTTDTVHKIASRSVSIGGRTIRLVGFAKGAAMIGPRMGTMLGAVLTDAPLAPTAAQSALLAASEDTFNCITIDGHMSTNDTVLLLANGAAGGTPLAGADLEQFQAALTDLCGELAKAIPADGEGATHLVTLDVTGCKSREDARLIAKAVCESALVKTAIAGGDPNWGRIVSAAGYAGVPFNPRGVNLWVNDIQLYVDGAPAPFDKPAASKSIRENRDTKILLTFQEGEAQIRFWTTDLTAEYVRLNADYTT